MRIPALTTALLSALTTAHPFLATPNPNNIYFPSAHLPTKLLSSRSDNPMICPAGDKSCGVVTFNSGTFVSFGQGICMQLGGNIQSIYVARCYCSLWSSCTGSSSKDVFVGGMMMCEKPKTLGEFDDVPKYISCGGMN